MALVKVLIADDSAFMRKIIRGMLAKKLGISIVGEAKDGREVLELAISLSPEVILLDIQMPGMDGLTALTRLMSENPIPVIIFSAFTKKESPIAIECLEQGAIDVLPKPGGTLSPETEKLSAEMARKIFLAAKSKPRKRYLGMQLPIVLKQSISTRAQANSVVVAVAGNGGPNAIEFILAGIPIETGAAFLIVQHMPSDFVGAFAEKLDSECAITVKQAENGETIKDGVAYIAPGGEHMRISQEKKIEIISSPPINGVRPNGDLLFESAAQAFKENTIGLELTGDGDDGKRGMAIIKMNGGKTICQDEETCVVFSMPQSVIESGNADFILPLEKIAPKITELLNRP